MGNKIIGINSLITFTADNSVWRVFNILNGCCRMINTEVAKFDFRDMDIQAIISGQANGDIVISEDEPYIVDKGSLPPAVLEKFERNCGFSDEVRKLYGPFYTELKRKTPKPEYIEILKKYNLTAKTGGRIIIKWLQSGLQDSGLLDERQKRGKRDKPYHYTEKTGRKPIEEQGVILDDFALALFDAAVEYRKKHRLTSKHDCFVNLIESHYYVEKDGEVVLLPKDQRPTERQFDNYFDTHTTYQEREEIKTSPAEFRNNERLLFGTGRFMSIHPGYILESDALEMDLYLVSTLDESRIVGRAIIYMFVDVYSHCIVGASVGFENNSVMGLTNQFINLFTEPKKIVEGLGLKVDLDLFPSYFVPTVIRCDRGSDFKSDKFEEVCRQLGISRQLCTGATGSMKGLIEQSFRSFHNMFKAEFENKGYIQKRYDSNHKSTAMYTIEEVKKLVTLFIEYHNARYIQKFKLTRDMIKNNVAKRPIDIWNYGVEKEGGPCPVQEERLPQLLMSLLPEETATICREGVKYKNLYYTPYGDNDLLNKMQLSRINAKRRDINGELLNRMSVKIDPRSVNVLYYVKDGKVMQLFLNQQKSGTFLDLTWAEYDEYFKEEKRMDAEGKEANLYLEIQKNKAVRAISESVQRVTQHPSDKNIKEIRNKEKQVINKSKAVANVICNETATLKENGDDVIEISEKKYEQNNQSVINPEETTTKRNQLSSNELPDFFKNN